MIALTKTCRKCGESKPFTSFHKDGHSSDGLTFRCKDCGNKASRAYHAREKEGILVRNRTWREEHLPAIRDRKIRKRSERLQWQVYRLDFSDGGYYYGSTVDLASRLTLHRHEMRQGLHRNPNIRNRKYTSDSFTVTVVSTHDNEEAARRAEGTLINQHLSNSLCLNILRLNIAERPETISIGVL